MSENNSIIPWSKPWINHDDATHVANAVISGWISGGAFINQFEKELEKSFDSGSFLSCSNGTAALHLALLSLNLSAGDEIILPGYGFMAAANVATLMGLIVRFADICEDDFSMDIKSAEALLNKKTKAIVVIHNYGFVGGCKGIAELCKNNQLYLIEDCAEALFSGDENHFAGECGDISTYSFHATKTITTGEGGAISTRNTKLFDKIKLLRSHGMTRQIPYMHEIAGLNYRMTNFQAALGMSQLARIGIIKERTQEIYRRYEKNFKVIQNNQLHRLNLKKLFVPWSYPMVFLGEPREQIELRKYLMSKKIETRPGFICPSNLNYLNVTEKIEKSEKTSKSIVNLPMYSTLTDTEIDLISKNVIEFTMGINYE